jgi:hypothetical protein
MNCCFCGPVKNCAPFLETVFANIEKLSKLFDDYSIVLFYDDSTDNTLQKLTQYQRKNPRIHLHVNMIPVSSFRTHRIAYARNYCVEYIKNNFSHFPYFIMMDFDDPNCKKCRPEILQKYLTRDDWDGLSFNTSPKYYDIWGLSIYPFCFSYNHFKNNQAFYQIIQTYVTQKLNALKNDQLLPCISSFNGFSIYRTSKFLDCKYDGRVNLNLVPPSYMLAHMKIANSPVIYKDYGHVKGRYEDCEHRSFHVQAINKNTAKIMISPDILFC